MTPRVLATFWVLVLVAVVGTGGLSKAAVASPGPAAGVAVAASSVVLVVATGLAARILVVVGRQQSRHERKGG